jgi:hypothetical protein
VHEHTHAGEHGQHDHAHPGHEVGVHHHSH